MKRTITQDRIIDCLRGIRGSWAVPPGQRLRSQVRLSLGIAAVGAPIVFVVSKGLALEPVPVALVLLGVVLMAAAQQVRRVHPTVVVTRSAIEFHCSSDTVASIPYHDISSLTIESARLGPTLSVELNTRGGLSARISEELASRLLTAA